MPFSFPPSPSSSNSPIPRNFSPQKNFSRCLMTISIGTALAPVIFHSSIFLIPSAHSELQGIVRTTEDLLLMRALQIERRDEDIVEAAHDQLRMRARNKEYFDYTYNIRTNPLQPGDLVLLHNTKGEWDVSRSNTLRF
ncbi:hypothetical protein CIRG_06874 [Coccidioides immitis RMSCC 2394]|uniref:Uncharacterized protein n=1 Tax=Coccidioides immitis RMSCC 2394 TaxID=404692 RepID=A0A0J6YJT4_COCIT|nr:hypothetical protein CIRG_06874 [Coccidioides immitis RMSCC 2394]